MEHGPLTSYGDFCAVMCDVELPEESGANHPLSQ